MKMRTKITYLILLTIMAIVATAMLQKYPQDPGFHRFADDRNIMGVPNFWNVISNLPFLFVAFYGLSSLNKFNSPFSIKIIQAVLFTGVLMTGLGSAYYHLHPDNDTLVWDRIPMTIVFMSFLCATVSQLIDTKAGAILLAPLVLIGVCSVLWWHHTEILGDGDLRFYAFIQFYPMLFIPLIMILFPGVISKRELRFVVSVIGWYLIAKGLEHFDREIYSITNTISGHSLKHIAAGVATWYIVKIFSRDYDQPRAFRHGAHTSQQLF